MLKGKDRNVLNLLNYPFVTQILECTSFYCDWSHV